jgi:hypothetical protein
LEVRTTDTLFQIGVDLEVVSDVLQFVPCPLLVLRGDVRCEVELDVGQLEEVAQIPVVRVVGVVSDVQRRRPLLTNACSSCLPLDGCRRGHRLVGLGDVVEELSLCVPLFERLLVEDVRKVHFGFVVGGVAVPEEFPDDSEDHNQQEITRRTFGRRWIQ